MDQETVKSYNSGSNTTAKKHREMHPEELYDLVKVFFTKNGATLDLGCGSGRDTAWLNDNGYPAVGIDAAENMLKEARKSYPRISFETDSLPQLSKIKQETFDNVLCAAVLMHIPNEFLIDSCINILRILKTNGRIIISFRQTNNPDNRESGKLYETIDCNRLSLMFESLGGEVLYQGYNIEKDRNILWFNLVLKKTDIEESSGIQRLQAIIVNDRKTATYKLALIRSLCEISRFEPHSAVWSFANNRNQKVSVVHIPILRLAVRWLKYYFPFIKADPPIYQTNNTTRRLGFQKKIEELNYELNDFASLSKDLEGDQFLNKFSSTLHRVSKTIIIGPIKHSGNYKSPVFGYVPPVKGNKSGLDFGMITIPAAVWRDIYWFSHWIEDSLVIQWARLTEHFNKNECFGEYLNILTSPVAAKRTTDEVRQIIKSETDLSLYCVWSDSLIRGNSFEVDHVIPYSVWSNNDLWNMLPTTRTINNQKRDKIPSVRLIRKQSDSIISFWRLYEKKQPDRFFHQIQRALGCESSSNWENAAIQGLIETSERISRARGLQRFDL